MLMYLYTENIKKYSNISDNFTIISTHYSTYFQPKFISLGMALNRRLPGPTNTTLYKFL